MIEASSPDGESPSFEPDWVERAFDHTVRYWRRWVNRCTYHGRWREDVIRSALTPKLLTSETDGSIAAAATFGLPELVGGERNRDYRYTWIRDASLTAATFIRLGFTDEPRAFVECVLGRYRQADERGRLQIMYGMDGRSDLTEKVLGHFGGYCGSAPVRIGNGTYDQLQLDLYGEFLNLMNLYDEQVEPVSHELWQHLRDSADWVAGNWRQPDDGIWEVRGGRQEFLCSRLMCRVALDRALRLAGRRSLPAPTERWPRGRDEIHADIYDGFWHQEREAFIRHRGSTTVDASSLLMPLVGFLSPREPRWLTTLRELVEDSLVYRYRTQDGARDGLAGTEGTFRRCSYWLVRCTSPRCYDELLVAGVVALVQAFLARPADQAEVHHAAARQPFQFGGVRLLEHGDLQARVTASQTAQRAR